VANLYDASGRQIMRGDVLKVFHFVGTRRKRHYMYKQALETVTLGKTKPAPFLKISHLDLSEGMDSYYVEIEDGRVLGDYEIVQSIDTAFADRPTLCAALDQVVRDHASK
jgi:hypothetical protein